MTYEPRFHTWLRKKEAVYKAWLDNAKSEHRERFDTWMMKQLWGSETRVQELETALTNIQMIVRDRGGSDWDGVREFCKQALRRK
jgi:hypothetical protein